MKIRHGRISKPLYGLSVCLLAMTTVTAAWFYTSLNSDVEQMEFAAIECINMEVRMEGDEAYNISRIVDYPENLVFSPVSGTGFGKTMYAPVLLPGAEEASEAVNWNALTYDENAEENCFYCFSLEFRSTAPGYAVLSGMSLEPAAEPENRKSKNYTDKNGVLVEIGDCPEVTRPVGDTPLYTLDNDGTQITKDYIAGAARIALVNTDNHFEEEEFLTEDGLYRQVLLIPNDTYSLYYRHTETSYTYAFYEKAPSDGNGTEYTAFEKSKQQYYDGSSTLTGYNSLFTFTESELALDSENAKRLKLIKFEPDGKGNYTGALDVCVWIEGYDNEAKDILSGGEVTLMLCFSYQAE